jgi:hypothetical protein
MRVNSRVGTGSHRASERKFAPFGRMEDQMPSSRPCGRPAVAGCQEAWRSAPPPCRSCRSTAGPARILEAPGAVGIRKLRRSRRRVGAASTCASSAPASAIGRHSAWIAISASPGPRAAGLDRPSSLSLAPPDFWTSRPLLLRLWVRSWSSTYSAVRQHRTLGSGRKTDLRLRAPSRPLTEFPWLLRSGRHSSLAWGSRLRHQQAFDRRRWNGRLEPNSCR